MKFKACNKHKRQVDIKSKWACSKQNEFNKENEKNKRNKYDDIDEVKKNRSKSKYPCKRNKGEHTFELIEEKPAWLFFGKTKVYKCTKCGKMKYDF